MYNLCRVHDTPTLAQNEHNAIHNFILYSCSQWCCCYAQIAKYMPVSRQAMGQYIYKSTWYDVIALEYCRIMFKTCSCNATAVCTVTIDTQQNMPVARQLLEIQKKKISPQDSLQLILGGVGVFRKLIALFPRETEPH